MDNDKLVSVLVTTYNNTQYLYDSLNGILNQDYPCLELVITDNHSDFFPEQDIREYIEKNNKGNVVNVVLNRNSENLGAVKNFNIAIKLSKGKYMINHHCDDVLFNNNTISNIINYLENNPELLIVVGRILVYDNQLQNIFSEFPHQCDLQLMNLEPAEMYKKLCEIVCSYFPSPGLTYTRELIEKYGYYDERYYALDDLPRFMSLTRRGCKIGFVNNYIMKYRLGGNSFSDTLDNKIVQEELKLLYEREIEPFNEKN